MDPTANLNAEEREAFFAEVSKKYPRLSREQLEAVIAGHNPFPGKESEKQGNSDVDQCVALAKDLYDTAVELAKEIKNPIGRAVALFLAKFALVMAKIKCMDDYGD